MYKQFIKYCIIGVSGVTLDFLVFIFLTKFINFHYQYANVIGVSCGITNNFIWNAFINFKINDKLFKRFVSFYCVGLLGMGLSAGFLYLFVEICKSNVIFAKISIIFITTLIQFLMNKRYTFKEGPDYV